MKIIDARSGEIMTAGKNVFYGDDGDGEKMKLDRSHPDQHFRRPARRANAARSFSDVYVAPCTAP